MVSFQDILPTQRQQTQPHQQRGQNVGNWERIATGALSGLLAARAIARPSMSRLAMAAVGGGLLYRSVTGYCPLYDRLGINRARHGAAKPHDYYVNGIHVEMAYTIDRPVEELYGFWRNFENLPRFMRHLHSVRKLDERRSHWVARAPAGQTVEWDAEIINEEPNRMLAWRSLENADVHNAGSVWFIPSRGQKGTQVRVVLEYIPPAGRIGSTIAWLFGEEPKRQIQDDLRRFKDIMERSAHT